MDILFLYFFLRDKTKMSSPFSSIDSFPVKIFQNPELLKSIVVDKKVIPYSIHLNPTNKCNFCCSICVCGERDKKMELSLRDMKEYVDLFKSDGTKTIILTGGGEPLMHPNIIQIINYIHKQGIELGLVTNGVRLNILGVETLNKFTWIRVSSTDDLVRQTNLSDWLDIIEQSVKRSKGVDWGFSHVLTSNPNYNLIKHLSDFAKLNNFTHIRLSLDKTKNLMPLDWIKNSLQRSSFDDSLIIYEGNNYKRGMNPCYVSHLKPVIGADGYIYPCCNISFASSKPDKAFVKRSGLREYFDGGQCDRCYLFKYNEVIDALMNDCKHKVFV